jgi:hypothetical protein
MFIQHPGSVQHFVRTYCKRRLRKVLSKNCIFGKSLLVMRKKNERMKKIKSRKGQCSFLGALLWVVVGSRLKLMRT